MQEHAKSEFQKLLKEIPFTSFKTKDKEIIEICRQVQNGKDRAENRIAPLFLGF
jgi:hypothetical protein